MPAGDFFGGFAKTVGAGWLRQVEQNEQDQKEQRRMQIELALSQANRPDLRPELRPVLMGNIMQLVGMQQKGSKGKEFDAALQTVLGMMQGPQTINSTQNQITGELPSAAKTAVTPTFQAGGEIPGIGEYQPMGATIAEPGIMANPVGTKVVESVPTRKSVPSAFYSPEEMMAQQLKMREGELALQSKYRPEQKAFQLGSMQWKDPKTGKNKGFAFDATTGEGKIIDLPEGTPIGVQVQQERTKAAGVRNASVARKKVDAKAAELALAANPNLTDEQLDDPKVMSQFTQKAAQELIDSGELSQESARAGIEYKRAGAEATRRNLPKQGEPTPPSQRKFTQASTRIGELERERSGLKKVQDYFGKKLKNGQELSQKLAESDPDKFFQLMEKYNQQLNEEMESLKKERMEAATQEGMPTRDSESTEPASEVPKRGGIRPPKGKNYKVADIIPGKDGKRYMITGQKRADGTFPVQPLN